MMKEIYPLVLVLFFFWSILPGTAIGADGRLEHKLLEEQQQELIQKASKEKQEAAKEAAAQAAVIKKDKNELQRAIARLKQENQALRVQNQGLESDIGNLKKVTEKLREDLVEVSGENREFEGTVRGYAKDLKALLLQSLQSGLHPDRHAVLEPLILQQKTPSMEDVRKAADLLFQEILLSGEVRITQGQIVDRNGKEQQAQLLLLGNFTGIYSLGSEVGFLLYSDQSQRYFALSKLPSARIAKNISSYIAGQGDAVYMDISKGGAIRQMTHQLSLAEQIPKGGVIVWPILLILILAVLIFIERLIFFFRKTTNDGKLMLRIKSMMIQDDWEGCRTFLESKRTRLIPKVLLTALALKDKTRPEIENALQEAILSEIPAIERFLSTLGMLAAIAPLLGLLGTVTGMINTFHAITYFGTGDPRMMSGGISEALVTTMLGLSAAIPIMLGHTLLSRKVETQIMKMEEKSVAFVNLVFKTSVENH
ncbi:MotA/TolQ/ExbB proton channel family protein [Desulfospira joergensenii]|uniref:MotA/TolQ/ExbB proton channel family protein n=1 Tax=Desulfospira joergensenii TaxID=53329 RepID=UPI0003B6068E|nr:MotA/TolQ/ExbB proton channel family protein [Desulfospira joergensenii]